MGVMLELVVDDARGVDLAAAAGVDRIELCSALALGALTPSAGLMEHAAGCGVPVWAMIRPRPGDFLYAPADLACALADIAAARRAGLAGVVIGATGRDGRLDRDAMARMVEAAQGIGVALHRAFDVTPDAFETLESCIALGLVRIMSAGHAASAIEGVAELSALVTAAAGRIEIMAGGGVDATNAPALIAAGITELHASCARMQPVEGPLGALRIAPERLALDAAAIRALQQAVSGHRPG